MKIGIFGGGVVGSALRHGLERGHEVFVYDKFVPQENIEDVLSCSVIFFCLPTPMLKSGKIELDCLEEMVDITNMKAKKDTICVIKSTAVSGTTRKFQDKYLHLKWAFCPEFLTDVNSKEDFVNTQRIVIGADEESTFQELRKVFREATFTCPIMHTTLETAEFVKYFSNVLLASKVSVANEMYQVAERLGIDYNEAKELLLMDNRFGKTHLEVPGYDGDKGFGGKCLVAGTKLRLKSEIKNVENINIGDKVYDGNKKFTEITQLGTRRVDRAVDIIARGRHITGSEDHIHFIYEKGKLVEQELKDIKVGEWIFMPIQPQVKNIKYMLPEKPNNHVKYWKKDFAIDEKFARLLGLFASEGCRNIYKKKKGKNNYTYETIWSFGKTCESFADEIVNTLKSIDINCYKRLQVNQGTFGLSECWIVRCRYMWLYYLLDEIDVGKNCYTKNIPLLSNKLAKAFIGGWLDGDGSVSSGTVSGYSESVELIKKIDTMLLSLEVNAQISKDGKCIKVSTREDVKEVCSWTKRLKFDKSRYVRNFAYKSPTMKQVKNGWIVKVTKKNKLKSKRVYSIETKSHRYVANNILTHNCFPKDLNAFCYLARELGYTPYLLEEVWRTNLRVRKDIDW